MSTRTILLCLVLLIVVQGCSKKGSPDERFIVELPEDATYGTQSMKEGGYADPIHGFFKAVTPRGFRIDAKHDKTTSKVPNDSPGAGKTVPTSRVYFKTEAAQIGVTVSRTFRTSVKDDVDMDKLKSGEHSGATVHLARWITIDGAPGVEVILTIRQGVPYPIITHTVSYVKDGLYHGIGFTVKKKPEIYLKYQADFIEFLHSYRSIAR